MIRAVIFDMDGLLIDSERLSLSCWRQAFAAEGLPFSEQLIFDCRGTGPQDVENRICNALGLTGARYQALYRRKMALVQQVLKTEGVSRKVGALTLLQQLKQTGYRVILATSTGREIAQPRLEQLGLFSFFDEALFGGMVRRYKPAPDIFIAAIRLAGCPAEDCLVLEDSPNGIRAAKAAGAKAMMIPDLTGPDEEIAGLLDGCGSTLLEVLPLLAADREGEGVFG